MMAAAAKKRGRPRKMREGGRLHHSPPSPPPPPPASAPRRTLRPRRRRPLLDDFADFDDYLDEEEEEEEVEEKERRGKSRQLRLILRLPPPGPTTARKEEERPRRAAPVARASPSSSSASSSSYVDDDDDEGGGDGEEVEEEPIKPLKKRQFEGCNDGVRSGGSGERESGKKIFLQRSKGFVQGVSTSSQVAGTPLPEKKLLEAALDKIQKKDTYGVFAEPVDPEELPDYFDVIDHPMDFGTVRKKLSNNAYRSFEQFEDDVFLICSNAMQYNAPDTIYFRQARSMQDIGRKEFQKLRTEKKCIDTDSKCEEKIRSESIEKKPLQKCLPRVLQESFVSDISSATTLASGGDACTGLSTAEANGMEPAAISNGLDGSSSLGESKSEKVDDLKVKGSPSKLGKKLIEVDENRRATYNIYDQQPATESGMMYDVLEGEQKQLAAVGLDAEYSYARSVARFAGNLGPIAWRIASQRIESSLPSGVKFGCGWIGEYEPLLTPIFSFKNHLHLQQRQQQQQLDTSTTLQFKRPLKKDKVAAVGRKVSGNGGSKEVNFGIQHQQGHRIYNRDSDPVNEGNDLCGVREVKQPLSVNSKTQLRAEAAMLQQQNKQVTFNLASGIALDQVQECQPSPLNSRLAYQALQRPEIYAGVATSKSPGIISLDRKSMKPEPPKQTEAMAPCITTDGRVNAAQLSNGNILGSSSSTGLDMGFISKCQQGIVVDDRQKLGRHEHGLSDPSRLMGLPIKMFNQSNISNNAVDSSKSSTSAVTPIGRGSSNAADVAAARAWMSVGASPQSKLSVDAIGVHDNVNGSASTFYSSSWRTPNSSPRISVDPKTTSMSQAFRQPIQVVGLEPQVHNKGLVIFPQLVATDMSRFQGQIARQGLAPQIENKQNRNICPPDLNISFQPPGSPVRHASGILKDSQQPDLALQL